MRCRPAAECALRHVLLRRSDGGADGTDFYYESIDLDDAYHPQTILAYELNDAALPVPNGAPLRLRVERQLGYKHAKYVMRIELVDSFGNIARRQGRLLGGPRLPVVCGDLTGRCAFVSASASVDAHGGQQKMPCRNHSPSSMP